MGKVQDFGIGSVLVSICVPFVTGFKRQKVLAVMLSGPKTPTKSSNVFVFCGETFDMCNKRNGDGI